MRNRKMQRQLKRQYTENLKADILKRNTFESFETFIPKFNINIGHNDPTPYEAVKNIVFSK